jgi:hypothetical protein
MITWYSPTKKGGYKKHKTKKRYVPKSHRLGKSILHYPASDYNF